MAVIYLSPISTVNVKKPIFSLRAILIFEKSWLVEPVLLKKNPKPQTNKPTKNQISNRFSDQLSESIFSSLLYFDYHSQCLEVSLMFLISQDHNLLGFTPSNEGINNKGNQGKYLMFHQLQYEKVEKKRYCTVTSPFHLHPDHMYASC